jgi:bis(5'-nucleosyl)-tetraphosphatase (symmetrical)
VRRPIAATRCAPSSTAPDRDAWLDWLRTRRLALARHGWLCVHAGVVPPVDAARTLALAPRCEADARRARSAGIPARDVRQRAGRWNDTLQGPDRWRFVINVLTRIRFCTRRRRLDLPRPRTAPTPRRPAGALVRRARAAPPRGVPIAFGHWSTLGLINRPDLLALDTGCVWGGALTAVRVDGGRRDVLQVPCPQARNSGTRSARRFSARSTA